MQLKSSKKKKPSSEESELFQKFMVEEMKLWKIENNQVVQTDAPFIPSSQIKQRFEAYKKRK